MSEVSLEFHNVQSLGAFPGNQRRTSVNFFSNFYVQLNEISDVKQTNYDYETDEKGFEKRQNINH